MKPDPKPLPEFRHSGVSDNNKIALSVCSRRNVELDVVEAGGDVHLAEVSGSARFYQRRFGCQAEPVHVAPGLQVVQAIQHDVEAFEEVDAILLLLDVRLQIT